TLFDFLHRRAAQLKQQRAERRTSKDKAGSPAGAARGARWYALADRLYFRVWLPPSAPPADAVAERFTDAFLGVWGRIAGADRRRLLSYWRGQPPAACTDPHLARYSRPVIRVIDRDPSPPVCGTPRPPLTTSAR